MAPDMRTTVELVDAAVWAEVIRPDRLPAIATELLVAGADSPALRTLAGADVGPHDHRDVLDAFAALVGELGVTRASVRRRTAMVTHLIAVALADGVVAPPDALPAFSRLAIAAEYPDDEDLMRLYGLEDEWAGRWGRLRGDIEKEVLAIARDVASRDGRPPQFVVAALASQ